MTKNELIEIVLRGLISQRETLNYKISELNQNELSYLEKKSTLEIQISNIDFQIDNKINSIIN